MTDIFTDANSINKLAAEFESVSVDTEVVTIAPPSNEVILPGGYITKDNTLVKYAEIRELNGADEEALAKTNSPGKSLKIILARGLVKIGEDVATAQDIDSLLAGDQEAILLGIRSATFGNTLDYTVSCPKCSEKQDLVIDLEKDVEIVHLSDPFTDRIITVEAKAGTVVMTLPNGVTTKKLAEAENKTFAELVTILLAGCIVSVNNKPSLGASTALSLGLSDRELLVQELYTKAPGPRLGEVHKTCKACGDEMTLALSLADLFRL